MDSSMLVRNVMTACSVVHIKSLDIFLCPISNAPRFDCYNEMFYEFLGKGLCCVV